jgi:hypothetical protein
MKYHAVFTKDFIHITDKLIMVFLVLIVESITALIAAEFLIRPTNKRLIAKQAISFNGTSI